MAPLSERRRDRAVSRLKRGYASGELATQTFERRLERALHAETSHALRQATVDLDPRSLLNRLRARLTRAAAAPSSGLLLGLVDDRPKIIGRSRECDVVLPNDSVSRRHAMLVRDAGGYLLSDLGSTNATYVNGSCITEAEVVPGDHVQLGEVRLIL